MVVILSSGRWVKCGHLVFFMYRQTSNIKRTLVGNKVVHHSDVVGASPKGLPYDADIHRCLAWRVSFTSLYHIRISMKNNTARYFYWCNGSQVLTCSTGWPFNSLAPERFEWNFWWVIFQLILVIDGWGISYEVTFRWMSLDLTDEKSTMVHVMAWCRQSLLPEPILTQISLPYGVTRPQWVKVYGFDFFTHRVSESLVYHVSHSRKIVTLAIKPQPMFVINSYQFGYPYTWVKLYHYNI